VTAPATGGKLPPQPGPQRPATPDEDVPRGGMFRAMRVRNYRLYLSGQIISLTGTWMQRVAQDWLVLELSDSGIALGITTALQFGPTLLFSLWGGVLADRYDKRKILMVTQSAMALIALSLGLLDLSGAVTIWHVYLLAGLLGITSALDVPVRQSFVVEMVGKPDLTNAVSLNAATFNTARILGPAIAGLMINAVGTGWVFLVNAGSTVSVITVLGLMRASELHQSPRVARAKGQLREGLRYVRRRTDLMLTMLMVFTIGTFGLNFQVTLALVARFTFGRGAGSYGLLSTALAVGSLCGALLATRRRKRARLRFLFAALLAFGLLEITVGLMPTYLTVALVLVPAGAVALSFTVAANTSVQLSVDPTMRGRVMALYLLCFMGGTPIGAPAIGALADAFGARFGLMSGGIACVLMATTLGVVYTRRHGIGVRTQLTGVRTDVSDVVHRRSRRSRPQPSGCLGASGTVPSRRGRVRARTRARPAGVGERRGAARRDDLGDRSP
jgi:MFS family permease